MLFDRKRKFGFLYLNLKTVAWNQIPNIRNLVDSSNQYIRQNISDMAIFAL